jgi:hypothetical protein
MHALEPAKGGVGEPADADDFQTADAFSIPAYGGKTYRPEQAGNQSPAVLVYNSPASAPRLLTTIPTPPIRAPSGLGVTSFADIKTEVVKIRAA